MKTRVNQKMLELLGGDPAFHEPSAIDTPTALLDYATVGFKEVDGCVVPASYPGTSIWSANRPRIPNADDETGFECSISKLHIEDFFETPIELEDLARKGCDFAFFLGSELSRSNIDGQFQTIVSVRPAAPSSDVGDTCIVRYHKLRREQVWLDDNLENYKEEAIAVFDF